MRARGRRYVNRSRVNVEDVHRYMWSFVDHRFRVAIRLIDLATAFGVTKPHMHEVIQGMRASGRIKYVDCKVGKTYVYEVSNPNCYDRHNPETHLARRPSPAWG